MKIGIFYNTRGIEKDISKLSAENIARALRELGHKPLNIPFSSKIDFSNLKIDIAFNLAYGKNGEDGTISSLIKKTKIPYIGPSIETCSLTYDKLATKRVLSLAGIPTPNETSSPPLVCKAITGGSSKNIYFIKSEKQMKNLQKFIHSGYFIEEFLPGREFCICAFKSRGKIVTLPIAEIKKKGKIFGFQQKYKSSKNFLKVPAKIEKKLARKIEVICIKCFEIFKCDFYTKVDIILDKTGQPCVLEVDGIPGFGPKSIMPKCAEAAGIPLTKLIKIFLDEAINNYPKAN